MSVDFNPYAPPLAMIAFWPTAIALGVGDIFLRRKVAVEYALCARHWRLRAGVRGGFFGAWALLIGFSAAGAGGFHAVEHWWFWAVVVAMFVLAIVASTIYRFTLARVRGEQIWLRGTGRPFFESLPALQE